MKLRTRLPRASTTAAAAAAAPIEQPQTISEPASDPGITSQQCAQILQQLGSFDTQKLFTGLLTADGRLGGDGPQVAYTLRYRSACTSG